MTNGERLLRSPIFTPPSQWQPRDESDRVAASANLSLQANTQATLSTTPLDAVTYDYDDPDWGDLMTGYVKDGTAYTVTSDTVGNPLSDGERTYTWKHGRQIDTMTKGGVTWTYEYNSDGLRTARISATKDYFYVYNGDKLTQVTIVDKSVTPNATTVIDLGYDATGTPLTLTIDGETYYYLTNIQGDVMGVIDASGVRHVSYFYDGFGRSYFLANTDDGDMISSIDPLGYRGYLLDNGTGLYYLQSRSYNPKVGRFINADAFVSTGQGILGNNMFAYCNNNPVNLVDPTGHCAYLGSIHAPKHDCRRLDCLESSAYNPNAIDLTGKLTTFMEENAKTFEQYIEENGNEMAILYFYLNVTDHGSLDIKRQADWKFEQGKTYMFNGKELRQDDIGNINYGYVGSVLFSLEVLYCGGGLNHIKNHGFKDGDFSTWYDDYRDREMITYGAYLYDLAEAQQ